MRRVFFIRDASKKKRNVGLDLIRAIAIAIVVFFHGDSLLPTGSSKYMAIGGVYGVELFFVLSGFLIGTILLKVIAEREASLRSIYQFWIRRWFRTLPNYYLFLLANVAVVLVLNEQWRLSLEHLVFVQHFTSFDRALMPEAWSLCIEEWFYLSFPVTAYACCRIPIPKKYGMLLAIGL